MRKGYNGLQALVGSSLNENLLSGHLFVFSNRSRTRIKVLSWWRDPKKVDIGKLEICG